MRRTIYIALLLLAALTMKAEAPAFWHRFRPLPADTTQQDTTATEKKVQFHYDVDFSTRFDNREYQEPGISQTIFHTSLAPEIGVRLLDRDGGHHQLVAGVNYIQPIGGNWKEITVLPTAYYRYRYKGFDVALGAIPYRHRIQELPHWLMYDSIAYMHPNIQGAMMSYQGKDGFVEFMCDWRGSQTKERREMFRLVVDGQYEVKGVTLGGWLQMNHKAKYKEPREGESVCDDIYLSPQIGYNLGRVTPLDSFQLKIGYIYGFQRKRLTDEVYQPHGLTFDLYANWWFLGIKESLYWGKNLMPLYAEYGTDLNQGDPFYQQQFYSRTDIFLYLYRSAFAKCYFSWNIHTDGKKLSNQQQLVVHFNLDARKNKHYLK